MPADTLKRKRGRRPKTAAQDNDPSPPPVPQTNHAQQFRPRFNRHSRIEVPFTDRLGHLCLAAEGLPTEPPEPTLMLGAALPATKIGHLSRMDLNQEQIKRLLPFLEHFARTGKLPAPD